MATSLPLLSIAERMAVGYNSNDGSVATLYSLGWDSPSGQMYSNIDDMNKVLGCVVLLNPHVHACVMYRVGFTCMVMYRVGFTCMVMYRVGFTCMRNV